MAEEKECGRREMDKREMIERFLSVVSARRRNYKKLSLLLPLISLIKMHKNETIYSYTNYI